MRSLIITVLLIVSCSFSWAFEPITVKPGQVLASFDQPFQLKSGDVVRLHGLYTYNSRGEKELLVYLVESHILTLESEQLVLVARDLDDDGLVDTWFYQLDSGDVWSLPKALKGDRDFATFKQVLDVVFDESGRWMVGIVMRYAFENLTLTGSDEYNFWAEYEKRQIDIIDAAIRIERLLKLYPNDPSIITFKKMNAEAWISLFNDFNKHNGTERFKVVGGDVALFFLGGTIAKGLGWAGKVVINKLGMQELITAVNKMGEAHYLRLKARMSNSKNIVKAKFPYNLFKPGVASSMLTRMWAAQIHERPPLIIEELVMKSRIGKVVAKNLSYFMEGLKEIYAEKGYILFSSGIQLATETIARGYLSYSDVPLILDKPLKKGEDILNKIGSDKELVQNLTYLGTETAAVAAVSKVLELKGMSLAKRFMICGFVSTMNSMIMGKVIKDEVNVSRMAGDTAWEVVVGNSQVLFDLWQWQKWKELAQATGTKQLKLVGVLVTLVHQTAGYYYYSKWAELLEGKTLTTPNLAPAATDNLAGAATTLPTQIAVGASGGGNGVSGQNSWQPVLVPVYAAQ